MVRSAFALLTALCFATSSFAGPIQYSGTDSAVFTNPIGGSSSGAGTSQFQFGGNNGATLSFTPSAGFTATQGVPFQLGYVSLSSGTPANVPSQVTLSVNLDFQTPAGLGTETFNFATGISTAGRDTVGTYAVSFDAGGKSMVNGPNMTQYTLELYGLTNSPSSSTGAFSSLTSTPANCSSGYLWAELTQKEVCPQAPEPGTLLLAAIALGAFGLRRWRSGAGSGQSNRQAV
jgi:hypothetical protein